mgnify:CR=1 FL=1
MNNLIVNQMITELLESMQLYNVGLFVGQGIKMEDLPDVVLSQKWRFVITSQKRGDFGKFFSSDQRDTDIYTELKEIKNISFSSINLPVIQLLGFEGKNELDDMTADMNAFDIMGNIVNKLDTRSKLVVIGYNPIECNELKFNIFFPRLSQIRGAKVFIFNDGINNDFTKKMKELVQNRNDYWCESSLSDALNSVDYADSVLSEVETSSSKQLFYKGNKAAYIENTILLKCQNFAQLLTDENVNGIKPIGEIEQKRYYELFLDNSSVSPQWYGYFPELNYYLKRPFEETLLKLVERSLDGKDLAHDSENKRLPIILEGDPGTSKSIVLAAVAYRIFKKHKNPVVFIKNEEVSFNNEYGREFDLLNKLLSEVERVPGSDERILIIWDTAAYRNVEDIAGNLSRSLDNLGRRFVLVCTAYRGASKEDVNINPHSEKKSNIKKAWKLELKDNFSLINADEKDNSGKCVYSNGRALFVATNRDLSEEDKKNLAKKIEKYIDLSREEKKLLNESLSKENDIFMYYFLLRDKLRERLAEGLNLEQRIVGYYVKNQLNIITHRKKEEKLLSPMYQALLKAGIELRESTINDIEHDELKKIEANRDFDLSSFNSAIALFSKYKLTSPYKLAFSMLFVNSDRVVDSIYEDTQLFDFIITSIPWLFYGTDSHDKFIFRFRNSREADIFLKNNGIDGEKKIKILVKMLDLYVNEYQEDEDIKYALINLARMMGPNSEYYNNEIEIKEHNQILQHLGEVISKLSSIRKLSNSDSFDSTLAQLEITFTREYYGKLWEKLQGNNADEFREKRVNKLNEALELAQTCINRLQDAQSIVDSIQKKYIQDQINVFAYEIAYCKIAIEKLVESNRKINNNDVITPEYFQIYPFLVRAINSNPVNGFSYNAMFKLFEHEYLKLSSDEQKLSILSEIRGYVEEARTLDIVNRGMNGRDEIQENIVKIEGMASKYPVDIDVVEKGDKDNSFVRVFNECLSKNKAYAIVFVCQQELDKHKLLHINVDEKGEIYNDILSDKQLDICQKVFDFLSKEEYKTCIEHDAFALYLKLRVAWLLFNKRPLNIGNKEAQLTYIENENWKVIFDICEAYINCKGENKKPIMYLIYALSIIQTVDDYLMAYKTIASMDKKGTASFASQARMRVPYIVCKEPGISEKYSGRLYNSDNQTSGYLEVSGIPMDMGKKRGVRVFANNIGERILPNKNRLISDLEIGIGYTGFSAYTETGRKNRGNM